MVRDVEWVLGGGEPHLMMTQGVHPRVIMEILGHSQISLTMNTYSHVIDELRHEAAAQIDAVLGA